MNTVVFSMGVSEATVLIRSGVANVINVIPHGVGKAIETGNFLKSLAVDRIHFYNAYRKFVRTNFNNLKAFRSRFLRLKSALEHRHESISAGVRHRVEVSYSVRCHATGGRRY